MKKYKISALLIALFFTMNTLALAQDTNEENEDLQRAVEERLEKASNRMRAFIGTVTDRTEDTMQLENDKNEIKLISVDNENTTFAKTNGNSQKISFEDVGIGDFVLSMGTVDENNVLTAKRIIVSSEPEEIKKEAELATISLVDDDIQVEIKPDNSRYTLDVNSRSDITGVDEEGEIINLRLSSINKGDKVILIGIKDEDNIAVDRIHIIEDAPEAEE